MGILDGRRIGLLTASASRLGGGVFESVVKQARWIGELGGEPIVFALEDRHSADDRARFGEVPVKLAKVAGPAQIGFAPALPRQLLEVELDCLHLQGIWMYPSRAGAWWAQRTGRPYLISPRGMLDPWIVARGRLKKALARRGYERTSWAMARCLHALTGREAQDIARESGRSDSLVIPNAGPDIGPLPTAARRQEYLYLGRIHPKKNVMALIHAWTALVSAQRLPATARLTIAGWGEPDHVEPVQQAVADGPPSIHFTGPVFGIEKQRLLDSARFLILPTFSEGLPNAVLEAWAAGTPVLMSDACNLPEGFATGAARDCGTDVVSIAAALASAAALDDAAWLTMARAAHALAAGPFSASTIAARWGEAYAALMESGN